MHYFCEDCNEDAMLTVKTRFKVFIESTCKQCVKVMGEDLNNRIDSMQKEFEQLKLALVNSPEEDTQGEG